MPTDIETRKEQLGLLARELAPLLHHGLPSLVEEKVDLAGVQAGVESIRTLLEITRFASCGNGDRDKPREDMFEQLCEQLALFCQAGGVTRRVDILLRIQCPMEVVLAELRDATVPGETGDGALVLRLSSDVGRLLQRADTFSQMAHDLSAASQAKRQARRDRIRHFCDRYAAYSALLDFEDGTALDDDACRAQLTEWLETEARDLLLLAQRIHEKVYAGARSARATADWRSDLNDDGLRPVLASLLEPALGMLTGLCRLFEDAVARAGGDVSLYRRFTALGLEVDEADRLAA